jgi:hemerythrin
MEWKPEYSVKVAEIDGQHKKFIELINQVNDAINNLTVESDIKKIINELVEYRTYHFATEEQFFDEFRYKEGKQHKAEHQKFIQESQRLERKYAGEYVKFAFELASYLEDWLDNHMLSWDQRYIKCFIDHGLK